MNQRIASQEVPTRKKRNRERKPQTEQEWL
jgi:hypothetical protein